MARKVQRMKRIFYVGGGIINFLTNPTRMSA